jgi:hypothetical protein
MPTIREEQIDLSESRHFADAYGQPGRFRDDGSKRKVCVQESTVTIAPHRNGPAASEPIRPPDGRRQPGGCFDVLGPKRATRL